MTAGTSKNAPTGFVGRFAVLFKAMPELWVVFGVKLLGIAAYQVTNFALVSWLSRDFGYSDTLAIGVIGAWSLFMTIFTVLVGSFTDAIGLRKAMFLGVVVCIFARLVMAFVTIKWLALVCGLLPLALGEALGTPVLLAAVRRYSTTPQRSISFSLFYVMMNVGFYAAARIFDGVREALGDPGAMTLPVLGVQVTTYQTLFLISLGLNLLLVPLLWLGIRKGAEATDEGVVIHAEKPRYPHENAWNALLLTLRDTFRDTVRIFVQMASFTGFYRLIGFLIFIAFIKLVYRQMDYAYPEFGIRELGPGAPVATLWALNFILIIVLVPITGVLCQRFSAYSMVVWGTAISAVSVFIMALPPAWFQPLADGPFGRLIAHTYLGLTGPVNPWYVVITIYVFLLSVGEALYSPRVYEYAAAIAPKGQEASYSALSYVPFLLAKLLVGSVSGVLLATYCPKTGPRDSSMMWLVIALIAAIAPVGLIALRKWIRVPEAGRETPVAEGGGFPIVETVEEE